MGCIIRECACGYADGGLGRGFCPRCGERLVVSFDEQFDHGPDRGEDEQEGEEKR
jgi:hypothetical protein